MRVGVPARAVAGVADAVVHADTGVEVAQVGVDGVGFEADGAGTLMTMRMTLPDASCVE